jgi:hypothetical protein
MYLYLNHIEGQHKPAKRGLSASFFPFIFVSGLFLIAQSTTLFDPAMNKKPSYLNFNKLSYPWKPDIDYRKHPELYLVGKGEQGVLICEPYKSEIGQFWRFKTEEIARKSSETIYRQFLSYVGSAE